MIKTKETAKNVRATMLVVTATTGLHMNGAYLSRTNANNLFSVLLVKASELVASIDMRWFAVGSALSFLMMCMCQNIVTKCGS